MTCSDTRGESGGSPSLPTIRNSPGSVDLRWSPCRTEMATRWWVSLNPATAKPNRWEKVSRTPMGNPTPVSRSCGELD